ncbi:hypothetical protein [Rhodococcus erythropolis]
MDLGLVARDLDDDFGGFASELSLAVAVQGSGQCDDLNPHGAG